MFKRFKRNTAFTLAELLIVFFIIGVISGVILMTTRRLGTSDKFAYQKAYDSLRTAAYNAIAEVGANDISEVDSTTGFPTNLCNGLTKYINSQTATQAKAGDEYQGGTDKGFCNSQVSVVDISRNNFDERETQYNQGPTTPHFIANNGMRFFFTYKITERNVSDNEPTNPITQDIEYYVVFIDLDGEAGQNSVSAGDVVAFAVTMNADVIPLGRPAYDKHYLTARVVFPESEEHPDEHLSDSYTYFDAIRKAWGGRISFDDLRTIDFNTFSTLQNAAFHTEQPASVDQDARCAEGNDVGDFDCDIKIQRYY